MKILNRIVVFLMAAATFPIVFVRPLIHAVLSIDNTSSVYTILSALIKDTANSALVIDVSIKEIVRSLGNGTFSIGSMEFKLSDIPQELLVTKNWAIAAGVLLVVALLVAIIIMGCALFTQAHKTVMLLSAGSMICVFSAMKCFSVFARPFLDGTIDVGKVLAQSFMSDEGSIIGSIGGAFIEGAVQVDAFALGSAAVTCGIVFLGIALWTVAYYVTMPRESDKAKKYK